jgi:hypothetical protein
MPGRAYSLHTKIRNGYLAPKGPAPAQDTVTVIFDTDLSHYKDEIYAIKPDAKTLLVKGQQNRNDPTA